MTVLRTGASKRFSENWDNVFGKKKMKKKTGKKATKKSSAKKKPAKKKKAKRRAK